LTHSQPVLWRYVFSKSIQHQLVSHDNPSGDITNSTLELAAAYFNKKPLHSVLTSVSTLLRMQQTTLQL
jgi:hypothetical protein